MLCIYARNVNDALIRGIQHLKEFGEHVSPRGLPTLEAPWPVTTIYSQPTERVLFLPERDANPFFHMIDAMWILAGRSDVALLAEFNKRMVEFSDNGVTFNAAYGERIRSTFGFDQLEDVIHGLRLDKDTRQGVLQIWHPTFDLGISSKDKACNTTVYLKVRHGKLNMTVCCRSNDIVWGAYGSNAVQFSYLQEYIAACVGVEVGVYRQVSDSFHVYCEREDWKKLSELDWTKDTTLFNNSYTSRRVKPYQLVENPKTFLPELEAYLGRCMLRTLLPDNGLKCENSFIKNVLAPMVETWKAHKANKDGWKLAKLIAAEDWRLACTEWLKRRGDCEVS